MSYRRTADPYADFMAHTENQEYWLQTLPKCSRCGKPIQDDHYYSIYGVKYCPTCMESIYRVEND